MYVSNKTSVLSIFIVFTGITCLFTVIMSGAIEVIVISLLCFTTIATLLFPIWYLQHESIISPLFFLAVTLVPSMPLRLLYLQLANEPWSQAWFLQGYLLRDFLPGALLVQIAAIFIVVGYLIPGRKYSTRYFLPQYFNILALTIGGGLIFAIGTSAFIYFISVTGFQFDSLATFSKKRAIFTDQMKRAALGQVTIFIEMSLAAGLILVAHYFKWYPHKNTSTSPKHRAKIPLVLGILLILLYVLNAFASSVRAEAVFPLILISIVAFCCYRRVRISYLFTIVALIVFIFGFVSAFRVAGDESSVSVSTIALGGLEEISGAYNLGGFVSTTHALHAVPEDTDYQYGRTLIEILWLPVPRSWWEDKPLGTGFLWLKTLRPHDVFMSRVGGGAATGLPAEFYLNFGLPGVAFCSILFGFVLSRYYAIFAHKIWVSPVHASVYCISIWSLAYNSFGYHLSQGIMQILFELCVPLGCIFLLHLFLGLFGARPTTAFGRKAA